MLKWLTNMLSILQKLEIKMFKTLFSDDKIIGQSTLILFK